MKVKIKEKGYIVKILIILFVIIIAFLYIKESFHCIAVGAEVAENAYYTSKDSEKEKVYNEYYSKSYNAAEKKYHTSNRAVITIDDIKESEELEVLQVSATGYSIEDKKDNDIATSWVKVSGTGVFTVNLAAGEYLIDQERSNVLVRLPKPQFTHFSVTESEPLIYKDGTVELVPGLSFWNGSTGDGTDLAQRQIAEASNDAKMSISSNQRFCKSAEKSAETMVVNLVKEVNKKVPDLTVIVEFME